MIFSNKEGFVIGNEEGLIMVYSLVKTTNGYDFLKQTEMKETGPVKML